MRKIGIISHPMSKIFDKKIREVRGSHLARKRLDKDHIVIAKRYIWHGDWPSGESYDILFYVAKEEICSIYITRGTKNFYNRGRKVRPEIFLDELKDHPQFVMWLLWSELL